MSYLPKNKAKQYPTYMLETNFTQSCKIMPWVDDKIRIVLKMDFKPNSLNISGEYTIRPKGIFNDTVVIKKDVPYIIIKNQNNYQLRIVTNMGEGIRNIPSTYAVYHVQN